MTVVLAVGGISEAHKVAISRGAELIHVRTHRNHSMLQDSEYSRFIDVTEHEGDEPEQLRLALKQLNGTNPEVMLCLHDESVVLGAQLAEALELSFFSEDTAIATVDKIKMRKKLSGTSLGHVCYGEVSGSSINWMTAIPQGAVVLKPSRGRASMGVHLFPDIASVLRVIENDPLSFDGYIVEERKIGSEYSVESICTSAGEWHGITAKDTIEAVESGHLHPAPIDGNTADILRTAAAQTLCCLGATRGLFHTEIILDEWNIPHVVETHLRGGGDGILDLVRHATDLDLTSLFVDDVLLQLNDFPQVKHGVYASSQFSFPLVKGTIIGWSGLEEAKRHTGVIDADTILKLGDRTETESLSSYSRLAWAMAQGCDASTAKARARLAVDSIAPKIEKENDD